jgi:hypothetical protein
LHQRWLTLPSVKNEIFSELWHISIALIGQSAELRHFQQTVKLTSVGATRPYSLRHKFGELLFFFSSILDQSHGIIVMTRQHSHIAMHPCSFFEIGTL